MTVAAINAYSGPYAPNGATTSFPFTFQVKSADEVSVQIDGIEVTTGFSVSLSADGTGSVDFDVAPTIADGDELIVYSDPLFTQTTSFENAGAFQPRSHDIVNDRAAMRDIWLRDRVRAAVRAPFGEAMAALPSATERAGKFQAFDANGHPVVSSSVGGGDAALRVDLALPGGAALVGLTGGGSVQDYVTNPGFAGPIVADFPAGGFTNLAFFSFSQYLVNGGDPATWYPAEFAGNQATDAVTVAVVVDAAATNHQTNAISGWLVSSRAQPVSGGGDVVAFFHGKSNANDSAVFAINTVLRDSNGFTGQILTNELDFNVYAPDTAVNGLNLVIVSADGDVLTGDRNAITVQGVFSNNSKWSNGFVTADGGVELYALFLGSATNVADTARNSQTIALVSYSADNTRHIAQILGDSAGGLAIRPGAMTGAIAFQAADGSANWGYVNADGMGYPGGTGGAVTQLTSKATGVELNKVCGAITLNNAALAASAVVTFTLTDNKIGADDYLDVWVKSGNATPGTYRCWSEGNAVGSRTICVQNISGGSLSEAIVLGFGVNKRAAS